MFQRPRSHTDLIPPVVAPFLRRRPQRIVLLQPQDRRQHFLALPRRLARKFVGPPLEQKRRVDKSGVVHPHDAPDFGVRFPQRVAGDRTRALGVVQDEQIRFRAPPSRTAAPRLPPPPDGAVGLPLRHKLQLHPALRFAVGNQRIVVLRPGARLPPQTPGHRIQQRRLPVPVGPAQASQVNAPQIQRRQPVPVTQKIAQRQLERNHSGAIVPSGML